MACAAALLATMRASERMIIENRLQRFRAIGQAALEDNGSDCR